MKVCSGCGAILQSTNENEKGYSPKLENDLCQRCFRIKHYDDLIKSFQNEFDNNEILNEISSEDRLIIWVVDLFDFESNIIDGLNRHLFNRDIILVGTKRDLLPETLGNQKLLNFVKSRLKYYGISVKEILFTGNYGYDGSDAVLDVIDYYRNNRDVIIMGQANVGKSTLINALLDTDLTISRYPGTTLDLIEIKLDDFSLYDTPGLIKNNNIQYYLNKENLSLVVPSKVKNRNYQLKKDTSFIVGGLLRVDIFINNPTSVVFYNNESLNIHRTNISKANELWDNLDDKLFFPKTIGENKEVSFSKLNSNFDLVINGLGFIKFKNNIKSIKVYVNKNVDAIIRKGLI